MSSRRTDDRTAKARILDAAIRSFAENGVGETTARRVAELADVSPGLVIHHFGSMEGLRAACDQRVARRVRELKEGAAANGANLDVLQTLRQSDAGHLLGYLAAVLVEDTPAVARLVDEMVADAEAYTERFVEAGMLEPSADPRSRAAVLVLWSLGALVLHKHLERLLGVDLTDSDLVAGPGLAAYALPVYEIYSGILTDAWAERLTASLRDASIAPTPEGEEA